MKQRHRKHRRPVRDTAKRPMAGFVLFRRWITIDEARALFADPVDPRPSLPDNHARDVEQSGSSPGS